MLSDHKSLILRSPVRGRPGNGLLTFPGYFQLCAGCHYSMDSYQLIHSLFVLPLFIWKLEGGLLQGSDCGAPDHHSADNGNCTSDWRGSHSEEEEMVGEGGGGGEQGLLVPRKGL